MKTCPICQKTSVVKGGYYRPRAEKYEPTVKRRKQPNLQWATLPDGGRIRICAKCKKAGKNLQLVKVK